MEENFYIEDKLVDGEIFFNYFFKKEGYKINHNTRSKDYGAFGLIEENKIIFKENLEQGKRTHHESIKAYVKSIDENQNGDRLYYSNKAIEYHENNITLRLVNEPRQRDIYLLIWIPENGLTPKLEKTLIYFINKYTTILQKIAKEHNLKFIHFLTPDKDEIETDNLSDMLNFISKYNKRKILIKK